MVIQYIFGSEAGGKMREGNGRLSADFPTVIWISWVDVFIYFHFLIPYNINRRTAIFKNSSA